MTTTPSEARSCGTCLHDKEDHTFPACKGCRTGHTNWVSAAQAPQPAPPVSLPEDPAIRRTYPLVSGLLDYFPNALAEVAKLSFLATQQHHPDKPMHWDRSKSTDHPDNIMRHLVDRHTVDDKGIDHWAMLVWRGLAGYQLYLEEKHGYPPSRASRNLPAN